VGSVRSRRAVARKISVGRLVAVGVLAVIAALVLRVLPGTTLEPTVDAALAPLILFLQLAVYLNVVLAVFNMVPVPPLDGGNVVAGLLRGPVGDMYERLRPYGFLILYGMMFTGTGLAHPRTGTFVISAMSGKTIVPIGST